jgi:hypothetical protein
MTVPFYDLTDGERIQLTQRAIKERRTLRERWEALAAQEAKPWSLRATMAAELLANHRTVADFGCGTMILERHLASGTVYYPVDIVQRDNRTTLCDFNVDAAPVLPASAAACLGLLEYLFNPGAFLQQISRHYRTCVVSYCPCYAPEQQEQRRSHAWVNDFSPIEIVHVFASSGWTIEKSGMISQAQIIWRLNAVNRDFTQDPPAAR